MFRKSVLFAAALALAGCPGSEEQPPMCITNIDTGCAPLYTPTFTNVYNMTIKNSCGSTLSSCHSAAGAPNAGGLNLSTEQAAFDGLSLGRVKAGDPACSELIVRTHSPGKDYEMPPDSVLSEPTKCALVQWVQMGAMR
jgi:hypothetical protein